MKLPVASPLEHPAWSSPKGHPSSEERLFPFPPFLFSPWCLGFALPPLTPVSFCDAGGSKGTFVTPGLYPVAFPESL